MKSLLILGLVSAISLGAQAKSLICQTGDIVDIDIKIESQSSTTDKLTVTMTAMDGDTVTNLVNTKISKEDVASGKIDAIVSTTDLEAVFGGAYLDAGIVKLTEKSAGEFSLVLAAKGNVITAICK